MANYMKEVTMLLGLELNKEFHIEEHKGKFRITENGVEAFYDDGEGWRPSVVVPLESILTGRYTIKRKWKPKKGDIYYVPIDINPQNMYEEYYWENDNVDIKHYHTGLVCKTPEEAIAKTRRILATV